MSNQVATGLGLTMVGLGLSALIGKPYEGIRSPTLSKIEIPILSDIPILGPMIFSHDAIVYFSIILVGTVAFVISKTRVGLVLRAVGENQEAAHAQVTKWSESVFLQLCLEVQLQVLEVLT